MNNMNVTAEAVQTTNVSQPKHKWLAKGSRFAKKAVLTATVMSSMAAMCTTQAFAATGVVDTSNFITTACTVLKSVICLIGGGVGGLYAGLTHTHRYATGSSGLPAVLLYIGENSMTCFINIIIALVITAIVTAIVTWALSIKFEKKENA